MEKHMNHSTLVTSFVAAIVGVAAVAMSVAEHGASGGTRNDVGAPVSSRGAFVVVAAELSGTSATMNAWEASPPPLTGGSRLDNYRLERDSCCIGNE
jgi:hypothetical protein